MSDKICVKTFDSDTPPKSKMHQDWEDLNWTWNRKAVPDIYRDFPIALFWKGLLESKPKLLGLQAKPSSMQLQLQFDVQLATRPQISREFEG